MVVFKPNQFEDELPVDEHVVELGSRHEMLDGELIYVPPADEPHGHRHYMVTTLVGAHVAEDLTVAVDMLTRTSRKNDFAPDVSVYPRARDPRTGRRQIQELAFEVVSSQTLSNAAKKAAQLLGRGVRRVFAIDIEGMRVLEWSAASASWHDLALGAHIEDPAFVVPLPVEPLILAVSSDDAIQRALILKGNPVLDAELAAAERKGRQEGLVEGRQEGLVEGRQEGLVNGLLAMLDARRIAVSPSDRARILEESDLSRLERWIDRAARVTTIEEVLAER